MSQGPSWLIHGPSPGVRWAEEKNGSFGCFVRELLVFFSSWKAAKKNGLVLGVNNVVWGSDGDLRVPASRNMAPCQERWVEKKNGLLGSFERELLVFFLPESGQEKQACFRGKYICLKALMGVPGVSADQYIAPCQE